MPPFAFGVADPVNAPEIPLNNWSMPLPSALVSGFSARLSDSDESRMPSDFKTVSKLFAPVAPCANALVMARANELAPVVSLPVLSSTPSIFETRSRLSPAPNSRSSTAIRSSPDENESSWFGIKLRTSNPLATRPRVGAARLTDDSSDVAVRKSRAQRGEFRYVERLAIAAIDIHRGGEFAWRHPPEILRRETQRPEAESHGG